MFTRRKCTRCLAQLALVLLIAVVAGCGSETQDAASAAQEVNTRAAMFARGIQVQTFGVDMRTDPPTVYWPDDPLSPIAPTETMSQFMARVCASDFEASIGNMCTKTSACDPSAPVGGTIVTLDCFESATNRNQNYLARSHSEFFGLATAAAIRPGTLVTADSPTGAGRAAEGFGFLPDNKVEVELKHRLPDGLRILWRRLRGDFWYLFQWLRGFIDGIKYLFKIWMGFGMTSDGPPVDKYFAASVDPFGNPQAAGALLATCAADPGDPVPEDPMVGPVDSNTMVTIGCTELVTPFNQVKAVVTEF